MRRAVARVMAVVLICTPAYAFEVTPDEAVTCEDEGGCYLLTVKVLRAFAERFHQVGYEHCRSESTNNPTHKRHR